MRTAYEMRISDWSSDVCSSDLQGQGGELIPGHSFRHLLRRADRRRRRSRQVESARQHMDVERLGAPAHVDLDVREGGEVDAGMGGQRRRDDELRARSEVHTSELQSLMRTSYAGFCLKKKKTYNQETTR